MSMCLRNVLKLNTQRSGLDVDAKLTFEIDIAALKAPVPTNGVPLFKLPTGQYVESQWPLIKANFTSLVPTKSVYYFGIPVQSQAPFSLLRFCTKAERKTSVFVKVFTLICTKTP